MDPAKEAMERNAANRAAVLRSLREELVGPAPAGTEIATTAPTIQVADRKSLYGPYRAVETREEILTRDTPTKRYGVGVLHPMRHKRDEKDLAEEIGLPLAIAEAVASDPEAEPAPATDAPELRGRDDGGDDFDLSTANTLMPSTMGVSLLADLSDGKRLVVAATGGRYIRKRVEVPGQSRDWTWWLRVPVEIHATFTAESLLGKRPRTVVAGPQNQSNGANFEGIDTEELNIQVEVLSRPRPDGTSLLTVCLVNRASAGSRGANAELALFQTHFRVKVEGTNGEEAILPYPMPDSRQDPEQRSLDLLYRDVPVFGTGHGCSADWERVPGKPRASSVSAEALPAVQLKTVTPDIRRQDGTPLTVSMSSMVTMQPDDEGWQKLEETAAEYEQWIARQERRLEEEPGLARFQEVGEGHLAECKAAANRMRQGLSYLRSNPTALRAFQLANEAILLQQITTSRARREVSYETKSERFTFSVPYDAPEESEPPANRGSWRAFQIAFLLSSVESTGNLASGDRELVDLIWFPTGGGKTEAYLGLAAYSMFKRRLEHPDDVGVNVLMRYTLRLLTAQQFERAASLICAMEFLRKREAIGPSYVGHAFSIGIWLGGDTTPNRRKDAKDELEKFKRSGADSPFLISRCPWCSAGFGKLRVSRGRGAVSRVRTPGYQVVTREHSGQESVGFACPDMACEFRNGLPIYIIDEDVYELKPTMVIATIDKFAQLAWSSEPRALFGLNSAGERVASPPGLIIQDELHLISGPLGSLAGMLEPVIEELCTDRRSGAVARPKIVSSTATIRRYKDQVKSLYGRERVALFPPPGLDASDSFFAVHDREAIGPMYVGVHAPSFMSYQTEWVRALSALLQAPRQFDNEESDPWWTMLMYCNSIRDMGTAHTLLDSDVRAYFDVIWGRAGMSGEQRRYLNKPIMELTGGLQRSDVTRAMEQLSQRVDSRGGRSTFA